MFLCYLDVFFMIETRAASLAERMWFNAFRIITVRQIKPLKIEMKLLEPPFSQ